MDTPGFCCRTETQYGPANRLQEGCHWILFIATFILLISLALILPLLLLHGQVIPSVHQYIKVTQTCKACLDVTLGASSIFFLSFCPFLYVFSLPLKHLQADWFKLLLYIFTNRKRSLRLCPAVRLVWFWQAGVRLSLTVCVDWNAGLGLISSPLSVYVGQLVRSYTERHQLSQAWKGNAASRRESCSEILVCHFWAKHAGEALFLHLGTELAVWAEGCWIQWKRK